MPYLLLYTKFWKCCIILRSKNRLHHLCAAAIKTLEGKSPAITPSNGQYQTAGMFCQMYRKLHKITDHRTYSSAMYFLPVGSILLFQRFLPYDSKDIICDHCQNQHQFVALKLSRRESFNIHVRLDFTVILLTFSVSMVKINDCFVWQGSVCPVCAQFYIGYDKILPISVDGSFRDLINCAYSDSFLLVIRKEGITMEKLLCQSMMCANYGNLEKRGSGFN